MRPEEEDEEDEDEEEEDAAVDAADGTLVIPGLSIITGPPADLTEADECRPDEDVADMSCTM